MKLSKLLQIIKEELNGFYNDWSMNDEPSLADKYYEKQGIDTQTTTQQQQQQATPIDAELVGYVDKQMQSPITPVPVYKNPKTLNGFTKECRGILLSNGDLYVAQSYNAFHDNILPMLAAKGVIPYKATHNYDRDFPEEFVAVQRTFNTNNFAQSTAYDEFPPHYEEIFAIGQQKQPYTFKAFPLKQY
jgi:hypothetical protein